MRIALLKIISSFILTALILSMSSNGEAGSDSDFPYHIDNTIEKEKTYDYAFEAVWETAVTVLKEIEASKLSDLRNAGLNEVKASIEEDKGAGLIKLTLNHKGTKGFFSEEKAHFFYQVLLLEALDDGKTRANSHEVNFLSYDHYVFSGQQTARYVDLTPPAKSILEEILVRLSGGKR
jgi:hypothetical protein